MNAAKLYLDSAILVALHCEETVTAKVRRWIARQRKTLLASEWTLTECISAFGLKVRRREISTADAKLATQSITLLFDESIEILPIEAAHFHQAQLWLQEYELGLRAADALHLAIAHLSSCTLATYDKVLIKSAKGLKVNYSDVLR